MEVGEKRGASKTFMKDGHNLAQLIGCGSRGAIGYGGKFDYAERVFQASKSTRRAFLMKNKRERFKTREAAGEWILSRIYRYAEMYDVSREKIISICLTKDLWAHEEWMNKTTLR